MEPNACVHIEVKRPSDVKLLEANGYRIIEHEGVKRVCLPIRVEK